MFSFAIFISQAFSPHPTVPIPAGFSAIRYPPNFPAVSVSHPYLTFPERVPIKERQLRRRSVCSWKCRSWSYTCRLCWSSSQPVSYTHLSPPVLISVIFRHRPDSDHDFYFTIPSAGQLCEMCIRDRHSPHHPDTGNVSEKGSHLQQRLAKTPVPPASYASHFLFFRKTGDSRVPYFGLPETRCV